METINQGAAPIPGRSVKDIDYAVIRDHSKEVGVSIVHQSVGLWK